LYIKQASLNASVKSLYELLSLLREYSSAYAVVNAISILSNCFGINSGSLQGQFAHEYVMVIDADYSVSPYLYVSIGRQYGIHHSKVLRKVIVTRQFTIYQLTHTIIYDLPKRIQLHKLKVVVISGLLDQFLQDPYLHPTEVESLVSQIVTSK
jgi:hypothetical protein